MTEADVFAMGQFVDDCETAYSATELTAFLHEKNAFAFVAVEQAAIVGFAYGYLLIKPDGRKAFYLHAIDIMEQYQGKGYGCGLVEYINRFSRQSGCEKMFLITGADNAAANRCYEKAGGKCRATPDRVYTFY